MIELGARLQAVYDCIPWCECLQDVGCDHGKIVVKAVAEGKANCAVAVDISGKSLQKAEQLALRLHMKPRIRFVEADGIQKMPEEYQQTAVVIAGMGAAEIIDILAASPSIFSRYILVPHKNAVELRRYLQKNGFFIESDRKCFENGQFYDIISCKKGAFRYSENALYLGLSPSDDPVFRAYIAHRKQQIQTIMDGIAESKRPENLMMELGAIHATENYSQ